MKRKTINIISSLCVTASAYCSSTYASPAIQSGENPCDVNAWTITGAVPSAYYDGTNIPSLTTPISATGCAGVFSGNDAAHGTLSPSPNLGYKNDGLLNGQNGLLSPTQFISGSQLQDLKTPGSKVDPGWIMLGELNGNSTATSQFTYSSVIPVGFTAFSLSQVLTYTQTKNPDITTGGTWTLAVDKDIVNILHANHLFERSYFDHLAFEVKSGNFWAVYDFDFTKFNGFDLTIPYTMTGTWTTNTDFYVQNTNGINGKDISHMSVWARDPLPENTTTIPLPSTLWLLGIGFIALGYLSRNTETRHLGGSGARQPQ